MVTIPSKRQRVLNAFEGKPFNIQFLVLREMDTFALSEYPMKYNELFFMSFRQQLVITASLIIKVEQNNNYRIQKTVYLSRK